MNDKTKSLDVLLEEKGVPQYYHWLTVHKGGNLKRTLHRILDVLTPDDKVLSRDFWRSHAGHELSAKLWEAFETDSMTLGEAAEYLWPERTKPQRIRRIRWAIARGHLAAFYRPLESFTAFPSRARGARGDWMKGRMVRYVLRTDVEAVKGLL